MLEYIRNNVVGIFGFALIAILAFVFTVSFGQQNKGWGQSSDNSTIISVQGYEISSATLNYATALNTNREISANSPEFAALQQQVAEGLVERSLLVAMAKDLNITASTDEAMENVIKGNYFITRPMKALISQLELQMLYGGLSADKIASIMVKEGHRASLGKFVDEDGKFDPKAFDRTIRYRLNFKEDAFIEEQRIELIAQRMRGLLVSGITVAPQELRDEYNQSNDKVSLSYIRLSALDFKDSLDMSQKAIADWAAANDAAIKQYYETNKYKYTNVEKSARARHILIKAGKDADQVAKDAAKAKITALLARVKAGEDFASLASANSEDEGSAKKGGDLGFNPKGVMVPAFDDVMFALKPGEISDVVETEFGFHIIKLEQIREGNITLADARPEIAENLYREKGATAAAKKAADQIQKLLAAKKTLEEIVKASTAAGTADATAAAATPDTQAQVAAPVKPLLTLPAGVELSIQTTSDFNAETPLIPGIGKSQELSDAAFKMTEAAPVSKKIFEVNGNFFAVALNERTVPSDEGFKEQKDQIKDKLLSTKIMTALRDQIAALRSKAMAAGDIESKIVLETNTPEKIALSPSNSSKKPVAK